MTASLAALISFIPFLILDLNKPFAGEIRVPPDAFQHELLRLESAATEWPARSGSKGREWSVTSLAPRGS